MLPNRLQKGDTIGVIAPSDFISKTDVEDINHSILLMENAGFHIQFGKYAFLNELGYSASPKQKAEDIHFMFSNKKIKAIFCAVGGYNSNTTFDYIDYDIIKNNPKIICGFSDSTSLLNILYEKTGLVTFHGSTFKSLTSWETDYSYKQVMERFVQASTQIGTKEDTYISIQEGVAEGILIGGNLTLFSHLICGKYSVDCTDKILFLEDLGGETPPAMLSNYFYYMKQNGIFDKIKGIWLGNYEHESFFPIEKVLLDVLEEQYCFPIIKSDNFGHTDKKTVIPIGIKAKIDTEKKIKIELLENCVK